ncbi:MAG TPA: cell envelope integrity EipB family protein [Hyphomicrobiaceae bacterium]|nr:cell envelope integrity EipB family protein [Hyphomicrobiaceae bacterium]
MRVSARPAVVLPLAGLILSVAGPCRAEPLRAELVFAPHRAVYELKLDRTNPGSGVAELTGRIVYELTGSACEGYTQNMRYVTQTINQDGETQLADLRTSSWESVPARRFRFSSTNYQNDQLTEQTQGTAERNASAGPVTIELRRPVKKKIELSSSVYFPIQHSMAVIAAARSGKRIVTADLFDGSEAGDKVYATSTAIGRQVAPGAMKTLALLKDGDKLDLVPSWPVSISYFAPGPARGDSVPLYEMSYRFHENGVTSSLGIDHGEFAIRGELKELIYLEASTCAPAKP